MKRRNFLKSTFAALAAFCVPAVALSSPQVKVEDTISAEELLESGGWTYYPISEVQVGTLLLIDMELVRVTKVFHTDTGPVFAYTGKWHVWTS